MIEVVYLANGERRPKGDRSLLIECIPGKRGRGMHASPQQAGGSVTLTIGPEALDAIIAELDGKGEARVYVRLPES